MRLSRRQFIGSATLTVAGRNLLVAQTGSSKPSAPVPSRSLGSTGLKTSILGVGGYHLGSAAGQDEVDRIVGMAIDAGINFFDNAWEYHQGSSEERLGTALRGKRDQVILMTKVCTHGRDKSTAMQMLEESLKRLRTDHLDIWQIHEVVYENDPDLIFRPNGAAEALAQAKKDGKVRFVGFTGHKDPSIHLKMLSSNSPSIRCRCHSTAWMRPSGASSNRFCPRQTGAAWRRLV